ncbi:MAG TPA: hypothetical protein VFA19_00885 [Gaiellaceae bacterium]|nr:hypothetical protein [Gaiellaceae bacterium]
MPTRRRRPGKAATFLLLVVLAEVLGRSATGRVDRALHVEPLAPSGAGYYPFLLVAVKVLAALGVAALLASAVRGHAAADAGHRLLARLGHAGERRKPRLQVRLSPRVWLASFVATSVAYLVQTDADRLGGGRWPLIAPWLHTYALPVFAALSVLVALAWSVARWVHAVEEYGVRVLARARRILRAALVAPRSRHVRPGDDLRPRRRFGLAFESRPPPLAA